ncbi:MAG TPA: alpha/beta hydrolase [Candidatus Paceibacterota bacterium]
MASSSPSERRNKDSRSWKEGGFRISERDIPGETGTKKFRVPYAHMLDRDKHDTTSAVKAIHVPIIFVAGELDEIVPLESIEFMFKHSNEPKKLIVLKGIGHDYRHNPTEIETMNKEIIKALDL